MSHDGADLHKHLDLLHQHRDEARQEAHDAALAAHVEMEAERDAHPPVDEAPVGPAADPA